MRWQPRNGVKESDVWVVGYPYIRTSHVLPHLGLIIKSRPGSWAEIREANVFFADWLQCTSIFSVFSRREGLRRGLG